MSGALRTKEITMTAVSTSAPLFIGDLEDVTVQFEGISGDSIDIEASNADGLAAAIPGTAWDPVGASVTADDIKKVDPGARWVRYDKTAGASAVIIRTTGAIRVA